MTERTLSSDEHPVRRWLDRVFRKESISGDGLCPTYLWRWTLLRFRDRAVYLHYFVGDDWTRDLHDHPKRFISFGLWGRYIEETDEGERIWRAPWIRSFPATHRHRLKLIDKRPCWTLVIVLKSQRAWGFWHDGVWIPWRTYLNLPASRERKSCP